MRGGDFARRALLHIPSTENTSWGVCLHMGPCWNATPASTTKPTASRSDLTVSVTLRPHSAMRPNQIAQAETIAWAGTGAGRGRWAQAQAWARTRGAVAGAANHARADAPTGTRGAGRGRGQSCARRYADGDAGSGNDDLQTKKEPRAALFFSVESFV